MIDSNANARSRSTLLDSSESSCAQKLKFHQLNPQMKSSKIFHATGDKCLNVFFSILYVVANILVPFLCFIIDYAVNCQPAVVKQKEREVKTIQKCLDFLNKQTANRVAGDRSVENSERELMFSKNELKVAKELLAKGRPEPRVRCESGSSDLSED